MRRESAEGLYRAVQDEFSEALKTLDPHASVVRDVWEREEGGGGISLALSGNGHIEKGAVNFSAVHGQTPQQLSEMLAARSDQFFATGVSIIVHPSNPHAPTFHANLRYFETDDGNAWFGGGADLTPAYLHTEDAVWFHEVLKNVCAAHPVADYPTWKADCDTYFRLPHRGEARGVGGIFFDHLVDRLDEVLAFQTALGAAIIGAYVPILERRIGTPFGDAEREWQEIRRGRYAEFNLVWDRGTRFGLETGGRIESILASLPPRARWVYGHEPSPGSPEASLLEMVRGEPRAWV